VSWAREVVAAIRKIILIEDRIESMTSQVKLLADSYRDLDRRLLRMEAKFELIEKAATQGPRRTLPDKSES
jgi:hypothetical protein